MTTIRKLFDALKLRQSAASAFTVNELAFSSKNLDKIGFLKGFVWAGLCKKQFLRKVPAASSGIKKLEELRLDLERESKQIGASCRS